MYGPSMHILSVLVGSPCKSRGQVIEMNQGFRACFSHSALLDIVYSVIEFSLLSISSKSEAMMNFMRFSTHTKAGFHISIGDDYPNQNDD